MKTILVLVAVVFALTFGLAVSLAWADEVRFDNAVTFSDIGPTPDCESVYGMGAGGLIAGEPGEAVENGVTFFELSMPESIPTGRCAGTIGEPSPVAYNGVTFFE